MAAGNILDVGAGARGVLIQVQQRAAVFDGKPKRPRTRDKGQRMQVARLEGAVTVRVALRGDQTDFLVVADGFGGQARAPGGFRNIHGTSLSAALPTRFRRSAFPTTKTEDVAIAAAASIGDSCGPPKGTSAPAATGISATL